MRGINERRVSTIACMKLCAHCTWILVCSFACAAGVFGLVYASLGALQPPRGKTGDGPCAAAHVVADHVHHKRKRLHVIISS